MKAHPDPSPPKTKPAIDGAPPAVNVLQRQGWRWRPCLGHDQPRAAHPQTPPHHEPDDGERSPAPAANPNRLSNGTIQQQGAAGIVLIDGHNTNPGKTPIFTGGTGCQKRARRLEYL